MRARWANREAGGSLGTTWLWGKGGRAVFARCHPTNYNIHPRQDDQATKHSFEDHLENILYERLIYCLILPIIDISEPRIRVAWVTESVD